MDDVINFPGTNARSFLFVDDVINAFDILMRRGEPQGTYNISQSEEYSNIDVLKSILVCLGKAESIESVDAMWSPR